MVIWQWWIYTETIGCSWENNWRRVSHIRFCICICWTDTFLSLFTFLGFVVIYICKMLSYFSGTPILIVKIVIFNFQYFLKRSFLIDRYNIFGTHYWKKLIFFSWSVVADLGWFFFFFFPKPHYRAVTGCSCCSHSFEHAQTSGRYMYMWTTVAITQHTPHFGCHCFSCYTLYSNSHIVAHVYDATGNCGDK